MNKSDEKKPYEKPAIIASQPLTARTVTCSKTDEGCRVNGGPVLS